MRRLRPHLTYANVMVTLLAIGALTGGVAYAADTIGSSDIINGQVKTADIGNNQVRNLDVRDDSLPGGGLTSDDIYSLTGDDIGNETLNTDDIDNGELRDEDIAEGAFYDFPATIGVVPANACKEDTITGINGKLDHLVLTPQYLTSNNYLDYKIRYSVAAEQAFLITCNETNANIDDGTTYFNLLVIDGGWRG